MTDFGELRVAWLETFVAVVEAGKRTAAGAAVGRHQGTVTRHIQHLQGWLGGRLLFDGNVPAALTPDGEQFLPVATEVLRLLREGRAAVMRPTSPPAPPLSGRDIKVP